MATTSSTYFSLSSLSSFRLLSSSLSYAFSFYASMWVKQPVANHIDALEGGSGNVFTCVLTHMWASVSVC